MQTITVHKIFTILLHIVVLFISAYNDGLSLLLNEHSASSLFVY